MKKSFLLFIAMLCFTCITSGQSLSAPINTGQKIDKQLTEELAKSSNPMELHPIIVMMDKQYEQSVMSRKTQYMDKQTRRNFVIEEMKKFTKDLQSDVLMRLESNSKSGTVKDIKSFWAFNGFSCSATADVIEMLAARNDVKFIFSNAEHNMLPETWDPQPYDGSEKGNAWNVDKVNAPAVWTFFGDSGYTGNGVVVAVIDTGVNYNHGDLANNMWDGGTSYPYHGYDFVNNDNNPLDDHGHGTHCSGTVAGYGTNGTQTGMAPGAKIMALKVLNSGGSGSDSNIVEAIEFAVEHGADVMSLSLGASGIGGYYLYRETFETVLAAGIPAAVAAGNDGNRLSTYPIPNNIGAPGNCPPPYLHPDQANILSGGLSAVISTGATTSDDVHSYFTSVGPATWASGSYIGSYNDYPYTAGSSTEIGLIRPDVAAPGSDVVSLYYGNNTGYTTMSGTSMATPCNAGVMALLLEANPELTPAEILEILETTAVKIEGNTTKNNYSGSGRIDALAAITNVSASCDAPTNLAAVRDGNNVNLTWNAADDVTSYKIYRDNEIITESATGTSYTDNSVSFPGSHTYFMKSNCSDGTSSLMSNTATVSCNNVTCAVIPGATITASHTMADAGTTVTVTVTPETGFTLNTLYYINESGSMVNISTETMQFEMPACSVTISARLDEPQLTVAAQISGDNVNVSWNSGRAVGYDLVRAKTNANGTSTTDVVTLANGLSTTQFTDTTWINAGNGFYKWGVKHAQQRSTYNIEVGTGTGTTEFNPFRIYYCYSLTQQIYTSEEIGMFGEINTLSFNIATAYSNTRTIAVYMKSVDDNTFSSWIPVEDSDKVYEGTVYTGNTGWLTITLDNPFLYESGNLMICVADNSGFWNNHCYFYQTQVTSSAIYAYRDSAVYDPSSPGVSGSITSSRPNIKLGMEDIFPRTFWSNVVCNTRYSISIAEGIEHGTISAQASAYPGDSITVSAIPDTDFSLNELYYTDSNGTRTDIDMTTKQFIMPASDVTLNATFGFAALSVTAEEVGDNVQVGWSNMYGDRGLSYNIYRAVTDESGTQILNRERIASGLTSSPCTDSTWSNMSGGYYKWGVRTIRGEGGRSSDELTVYEGTSTNYMIPAYIYYFDAYARSQHVIPATDLTEMDGCDITSLKYYRNTNSSYTTGTTVDVYLKEVDYTSISEFISKDDATVVYTGYMTFLSDGTCTMTFDTPYHYNGGNLLVGIENNTKANYEYISYYGQTVAGASVSGEDYNSPSSIIPTQQNFIPKTTFTYESENASDVYWSNVILNSKFNIAIDQSIENGTVTAPASADYGTDVTVEVTPNEGYFLSSLYYEGGDQSHPMYINPRTKQFTMPFGDVTIHAVFTMENIMTMAENENMDTTTIIRWGDEIANLHYDDDYFLNGWTFISAPSYWGIMIPAEDIAEYDGKALTAVQYYAYNAGDFTINIYEDGNYAPGTLIHTQNVHAFNSFSWNEFILDDVISIDGTKNLWITMYQESQNNYPMTTSHYTGEPNGAWCSSNGSSWFVHNQTCWKLRGCITDITSGSKGRKTVSFEGKKGVANDNIVYVKNENPDLMYVEPIQHRGTRGNDIYMASYDQTNGTVGEAQVIASDVSGGQYNYTNTELEVGYHKFSANSELRWSNEVLRSDYYNVNIDSTMTNGTVTANPSSAYYGQLVSLTVTPSEGYLMTNLYYYTADSVYYSIDMTTMQFNMPGYDVTVKAEFIDATIAVLAEITGNQAHVQWTDEYASYFAQTYTVYFGEYDSIAGGATNIETLAQGVEGSEYYDNSLINRQAGTYVYGISRTGFEETYWSASVYYAGPIYNITIDSTEHGTLSAPEQALQGSTVTVEVTPDDGYLLSSIYYYNTGGSERHYLSTEAPEFTMPSYDVTINGTFTIKPLVVVATEVDSDNVNVSWSFEEMKGEPLDVTQYYIYRKSTIDDGTPILLDTVTEMQYNDSAWGGIAWGVYKWGVQPVYEDGAKGAITWNKPMINNVATMDVVNDEVVIIDPLEAEMTGPAPKCIVPKGEPVIKAEDSQALIAYYGTNFGSFALNNPSNVTYNGLTLSTLANGACYMNDTYYISGQGKYGMLDLEAATVTYISTSVPNGMVEYNPVDGKMYGMSFYNGYVYEVNPTDGSYTTICNTGLSFIIAFTITNDGRFIVADGDNDRIVEIDKNTGSVTNLISVGFDICYAQDMAMDYETNTVYWAAYNATNSTAPLYTINLETNSLNLIGYFSGEMSAFANQTYGSSGGIYWSNTLDKNMWSNVTVSLSTNDGGSAEGATVSFTNTLESYTYTETVGAEGTINWPEFRSGSYTYNINKEGYYELTGTMEITPSNNELSFLLEEITFVPENLFVSKTGWAMWDAVETGSKEFINYVIKVDDGDETNVSETYYQLDVTGIAEGETHTVSVASVYTSGTTEWATYSWTYSPCSNYDGAPTFIADNNGDITLEWTMPEPETTSKGNWDLITSFSLQSAGQQGICTDGEYIYTSCWNNYPGYTYGKYTMDGTFIEYFNISGASKINDLTYDGEYFYGSSNGGYNIYKLDLANKTLIETLTMNTIVRHCSYDPVNDGFWVGNWNTLALCNRNGEVLLNKSLTYGICGSGYVTDNNGVPHLYLFAQTSNGTKAYVYDYNINTNTLNSTPIYDLNVTPGYSSGIAGGAYIGTYNGHTAFFGNVQQSPNIVGIYEIDGQAPFGSNFIGTMIWRDGELLTPTPLAPNVTTYVDDDPSAVGNNEYCIRLVYKDAERTGDYYAMSCEQCATPGDGLYWHADPTLYEDNMTVTSVISIDDIEQYSKYLEIGAFCGDECRGSARPALFAPTGRYILTLLTYGQANDSITFRIYDHTQNMELDLACNSSLTFQPDAIHGSLDNPYVIDFYNVTTQCDQLSAGNNWYSSYITIDGTDGLNLIKTGLGTSGSMIKSQTQYTQYTDGYGWFGSLTEADNEQMYIINMTENHELCVSGRLADPTEHPIALHQYWNWIGYPVNQSLSTDNALGNITSITEDIIKSQFGYSTYYEGYGWFGTLNTMEPGHGYMLNQQTDFTQNLVYPTGRSGELKANITAENNHWVPDAHKFVNNMSVTSVISIDGVIQRSENLEVAAICNGEVRGSAHPMYFEPIDAYVMMLTIYGNEGDEFSFRLYDIKNGFEYESTAKATFTYSDNAVIGTLGSPFVIDFGTTNGIDEDVIDNITIYPNPANRNDEIMLSSTCDRVEIFNTLGQKVADYQNVSRIHSLKTAGNYIIRITNNGNSIYSKILVK